VGEAAHGGAQLAARLAAGGRHAHLLVPGHEHGHALEVGDLGQAFEQLVHRTSLDGWFRGCRARMCASRGCRAPHGEGVSGWLPGPFVGWRSGAAERVQAGAAVAESAI
jgi:hypothetical protein